MNDTYTSGDEPMTFSYDAPQFFDFSKAKYQRYLKTLEKVLFPNSTSMSPLNPNTPLAILGNSFSSDEREDALWFQKVHSEHEGFSPRSPPHPLITPSPLPKQKRLLGSPRRVSSSTNNSQTPQSLKSVADDSFRFSNPKYLCSPPKFSPIVKSPLNHTQSPLMLTELLEKSPIVKKMPIDSFIDFEASPNPLSPKHSKAENNESFYDATPLDSPAKENQREGNHLLSYSPSPPVLVTKLSSSSHTPTSPLDSKREKREREKSAVFASKAQRVFVGVNLDNRKRRSSRGLDDEFKFADAEHLASNVSTPSKSFGNELKRTKVAPLDFCPPPARQPFCFQETKRKPLLGNNKVSTEDLKRLLNEHNQRIRPRLNNNSNNFNNNKRTMM